MTVATLPGPGRTIVVEPLELPREAPAPSREADPAPAPAPAREPDPVPVPPGRNATAASA